MDQNYEATLDCKDEVDPDISVISDSGKGTGRGSGGGGPGISFNSTGGASSGSPPPVAGGNNGASASHSQGQEEMVKFPAPRQQASPDQLVPYSVEEQEKDTEERRQDQEHQSASTSSAYGSGSTAAVVEAPVAPSAPSALVAEGQHLLLFIQNSTNMFTNVLYHKDIFHNKLCELAYRIYVQGHQATFAARIDHLYKLARDYLDLEANNIRTYFSALWMYHDAILGICIAQQNGTADPKVPMPDLSVVRKTAFDLLDRIVAFQSQLFETLIKPLGWLEIELQGVIVAQVTNAAASLNPFKITPTAAPAPITYWQHSPALLAPQQAATPGLLTPAPAPALEYFDPFLTSQTQAAQIYTAAAGTGSLYGLGLGGGYAATPAPQPPPPSPATPATGTMTNAHGVVYGESLLGPPPSGSHSNNHNGSGKSGSGSWNSGYSGGLAFYNRRYWNKSRGAVRGAKAKR